MHNRNESHTCVVVGSKRWNRQPSDRTMNQYPGQWHLAESREQLALDAVWSLSPRYVFFLHCSWKAATEIVKNHESVCFDMTDVLLRVWRAADSKN